MTDHELDQWLNEARATIDDEIEREREDVVPDFAAVIASAHQRAPEAVPAAWVEEAEALAPVVALHRPRGEEGIDEAGLDALIDEARELAEQDVAARRMAGIPPLPSIADTPRPARATGWIAGAVALAAVIAGLVVVGPRVLDALVDGARSEARVGDRQAEYLEKDDEGTGQADAARPRLERSEPTGTVGEAIAVPSEEEHESSSHEPSETTKLTPSAKVERDPTSPRARKHRSLGDRVAALDDEAQARWAAGELEAAEEAFRAIIELAGRSRYADLAYGDLFTLAHQRGDVAAERALWSEYLVDFPSGRFADDARAGLCRRASADERAACWQAYLDDFPHGVYRRAAEKALGLDAGGSGEQDHEVP